MSLVDYSLLDETHSATLPPALVSEAAVGRIIPTRQRSRIIDSIATEVMLQSFNDQILVLVTQLGRLGCFLQITAPPASSTSYLPPLSTPSSSSGNASLFPSLPPPNPNLLIRPVFGAPPTQRAAAMHDLLALTIGSLIYASPSEQRNAMLDQREDGELRKRREEMGEERAESRGVLLGIALKIARTDKDKDKDKDAEQEEDGIAAEERRLFGGIMEMVRECWEEL